MKRGAAGIMPALATCAIFFSACGAQQSIQNVGTPTPPAVVAVPPTEPTPQAGEVRVIGGAAMVFVPEGKFLMGSTDEQVKAATKQLAADCSSCQDPDAWFTDQKPQHQVYLDAFWMDKVEVTTALYKTCVEAGKCATPSQKSSFSRGSYYGNSVYDNFPVIYVAWEDAQVFCEWAGKRLPTEAEWEKTARGTEGRLYPWGDEWSTASVNAEERIRETAAVGGYADDMSPYGALDMAGNVREWVADWYDENYYANSPASNPPGAASGEYRILRGGSWGGYKVAALAASRVAYEPITREHYIGFRCVKSAS